MCPLSTLYGTPPSEYATSMNCTVRPTTDSWVGAPVVVGGSPRRILSSPSTSAVHRVVCGARRHYVHLGGRTNARSSASICGRPHIGIRSHQMHIRGARMQRVGLDPPGPAWKRGAHGSSDESGDLNGVLHLGGDSLGEGQHQVASKCDRHPGEGVNAVACSAPFLEAGDH